MKQHIISVKTYVSLVLYKIIKNHNREQERSNLLVRRCQHKFPIWCLQPQRRVKSYYVAIYFLVAHLLLEIWLLIISLIQFFFNTSYMYCAMYLNVALSLYVSYYFVFNYWCLHRLQHFAIMSVCCSNWITNRCKYKGQT